MTLEQIGKRFLLSRERIRQIESRAMWKLRHPVTDAGARNSLSPGWSIVSRRQMGEMAVCPHCGAQTDSPEGHKHVPGGATACTLRRVDGHPGGMRANVAGARALARALIASLSPAGRFGRCPVARLPKQCNGLRSRVQPDRAVEAPIRRHRVFQSLAQW